MVASSPNELIDTPLGKLVARRPEWSRVFERHQLDYCCQGTATLAAACRKAHLDPNIIVEELLEEKRRDGDTDWTSHRLADLLDHIVSTHHDYVGRELPRIEQLLAKVLRAHGDRHPELVEIKDTFAEMASDLKNHMFKEEQVLFPAIRQLEVGSATQFAFGSVSNPISMMLNEHEHAGESLARLRKLTNQFTPPPDACPTHRALYEALESFEADLHQHVHKENNILFPRAVDLEPKG